MFNKLRFILRPEKIKQALCEHGADLQTVSTKRRGDAAGGFDNHFLPEVTGIIIRKAL